MSATQHGEIFWVLYLVGKEKADSFYTLLAKVDVITKEQVVCFGRMSTKLEELQKIAVLAINIANNLNLQETVSDSLRELQKIRPLGPSGWVYKLSWGPKVLGARAGKQKSLQPSCIDNESLFLAIVLKPPACLF